jgi:hypothetical protein
MFSDSEYFAMRTLITVCILSMTADLCLLYQIGSPSYGYIYAFKLLPVLVVLMGIIPIVSLGTKWLDSSNERTVRVAWCMALFMPICLWEIGNTMLMHIAKVGGCSGC